MSSYASLVAMAIFMAMLSIKTASAQGESTCTSTILSLAPCLDFTTASATQPSSTCCARLAEVVKSKPQCLCSLTDSSGASQFNINETLALQLPKACNVETPPASQCKSVVAGGPVPSAPAPGVSKGGSNAPSSLDNSKASDGVEIALSFIYFTALVASYASAILAI